MKKILIPFCLLILTSCTSRKENSTAIQNDIPEALQNNNESKIISLSKRSYDNDLVEELYQEKVRSAPALQQIETMHDIMNDAKKDSLEVFHDFMGKNQQYYSSAKRHLDGLKDSLLKREIETLLEKNRTAYNNKIAGLNELAAVLDSKTGSADDRHRVLMLLISLAMMSEYQDKNLPSQKPIESVISNYDQLIQKMDSVISKNK